MPEQDAQSFQVRAIYTEDGFTVDRILSDKTTMSKRSSLAQKKYQPQDIATTNPVSFCESLQERPWQTLYEAAFSYDGSSHSPYDISILFLIEIAKRVIQDISQNPEADITRCSLPPTEDALLDLLHSVPFVLGCEFVDQLWIKNIYANIADVFNAEFTEFKGGIEAYFKTKKPELNVAGKVYFHLVEHKEEDFPFAFLATYSDMEHDNNISSTNNMNNTNNSNSNHKRKHTHVRHVPLKKALEQQKSQDELLDLLSAVSRAAEQSSFISDLIESGELFSPLKFTAEEAYTFLKETPMYESCGVLCRVPNFWKKKHAVRLSLSLGNKEPSTVGMDALMAFSPEIYLGDEVFTREEIERLLGETSGLAFLKGKWVELDKDKMQSLLAAFDELDGKDISLAEAIRMQSGLMKTGTNIEDADIEITNGQWLANLRERMLNPTALRQRAQDFPRESFKADLRHYQTVGFNWLNFMIQYRFGALLADDMGLGKTVQVLALLDSLRTKQTKTLLIIPASLIQNWKKEAEKFAPELKIKILHSGGTNYSLQEADVFITTYGMVSRIEKLAETPWDLLILDEAQAIKNHGNKQTKAVKSLQAKGRIAMTGTPVENRLSDLWSIFDFLNKGLLGSAKEFGTFARSLKDSTAGYEKLRMAVSPFILRRFKTDKSIIDDLPDKVETFQFTTLSRKQTLLYNRLVGDLKRVMADRALPGIKRRGIILASIMKFKQICNHPDQYIGSGEFLPKHSGKFETMKDICRTMREKRERVLVFTQFKEMTGPLAFFLETVFEQEGLILHGETPVQKRGEMVERFNGEGYVPFMVLSLKAGGVGLNLTAANHVVHFDRWWNPAIENQATDRAFRIGQKKNVNVYKFVTTGTIEEKIDAVIAGKQKLAGDVISASSGEGWITEMNNDELLELFRLEG